MYDTIRAINYTYDDLQVKPDRIAKAVKPVTFQKGRVLASVSPGKKLGSPFDQYQFTLSAPLSAPQNDEVFYSLEVELSFAKGHNSRVAIMIQGGSSPAQEADYKNLVVGVAGFFGAGHEHQSSGDGHSGHSYAAKRISKTLKYDITKELSLQKAFGAKELSVSFQQFAPEPANPLYLERILVKAYRRKK